MNQGEKQQEGNIYILAAGGPVGQGCCSGRAAGQQHSPWGHDGPRPSDGSAARPPGSAECNDCMQTPWAPVSSGTRRRGGGRGRGRAWLRSGPACPAPHRPARSSTASGSAGRRPRRARGCPQRQAAGRCLGFARKLTPRSFLMVICKRKTFCHWFKVVLNIWRPLCFFLLAYSEPSQRHWRIVETVRNRSDSGGSPLAPPSQVLQVNN